MIDQYPCQGRSALFFPDRADEITITAAQAICARCPARVPCARAALRNGDRFGIWAGVYLTGDTCADIRLSETDALEAVAFYTKEHHDPRRSA